MPAGLSHEDFDEVTRESRAASARETIDRIKQIQVRTRDRTGRIKNARLMAAVLSLKVERFTINQIAEILGIGPDRVKTVLERAHQDTTIDALLDRLDKLVLPMAVENVYRGVMDGDKEYTLRVLDGRGVFRSHKSIDAQVKKTVLEMKVVMVQPKHLQGAAVPQVKPGSVVGAPMLETGRPPGDVIEGTIVPEEPK